MEPDPDPQDPKASRACAATGSGPQGAKGKRESNGAGATFPSVSQFPTPRNFLAIPAQRGRDKESSQGEGKHLLIQTLHISNPNKVTFVSSASCKLQKSNTLMRKQ